MSVDRRSVLRAGVAATGALVLPTTGSATASDGTASGPTVYVGARDEALHAFDAETGERVWRFDEPGDHITSSPTVVDGTVYVGVRKDPGTDPADVVYAVDAATGEREWVFEGTTIVTGSPTVVGGTVYVTGVTRLYAIDADTGDGVWTVSDYTIGDSSPAVADGTVYVGASDEAVLAFDAATGDERWTFDEAGYVNASPTVVGDAVFVGDRDGVLYALDAVTGRPYWTTDLGGGMDHGPAFVDGTLYVGALEKVYAIDAESGEERWSFSESDLYFSAVAPTVADGTVYVGSNETPDGGLFGLDAESGEELWSVTDFGQDVPSSPTVVADPVGGDSVGSRVRLGTFGHHEGLERPGADEFELGASAGDGESNGDGESGETAGTDDGADGDDSMSGLGVPGAVAGLAGTGYLLSRRGRDGADDAEPDRSTR